MDERGTAVQVAALAGVFLLELLALTGVALWGWDAGGGGVPGALGAVAAAAAWAAVWGVFLSPKARVPLPEAAVTLGRGLLVGVAALAWALGGFETVAVALVLGLVTTVAVLAATD